MAKNTSGWNWRTIVNFIAFVAICTIGVALLIGKIAKSGSELASALHTIAEILAYMVTAVSAFFFAVNRRHWAYYLVWFVCVALIVVLMII